eukprot:3054661-Amphidinium_carterae.1
MCDTSEDRPKLQKGILIPDYQTGNSSSDRWLHASEGDCENLWLRLLQGEYGCLWLCHHDVRYRCLTHLPQNHFPSEDSHYFIEAHRLGVGFPPVPCDHLGSPCPPEPHVPCEHLGSPCSLEPHVSCDHPGCPSLQFQEQHWLVMGKKQRHKELPLRLVCTVWSHHGDWQELQSRLSGSFAKVAHTWNQSHAMLVGIPKTLVQTHDEPIGECCASLALECCVPTLLVDVQTEHLLLRSTDAQLEDTLCVSHGHHVQSNDAALVLYAQETEFAVTGKIDPQKLFIDLLLSHLRRHQRISQDTQSRVTYKGNGDISGDSCAKSRQMVQNATVPHSTRTSMAFEKSGYLAFGAITARGWNRVHPNTEQRGGLLAAIHDLARHRSCQHPYLACAIIHGKAGWHVDPQNIGLSSTVALGDFTGGLLEVADGVNFETRLVNTKLHWHTFESDKCPHRVTDIVGDRVSIAVFTPANVLRLSRDCWKRLLHADFPVFAWLECEGNRLQATACKLDDWQKATKHCQVLTQGVLGSDMCLPVMELAPIPEELTMTSEPVENETEALVPDTPEQHMQETLQSRAVSKQLPVRIAIEEPTPQQRQAIHRAHVNLGHPRLSEFLWALKLAGVGYKVRLW